MNSITRKSQKSKTTEKINKILLSKKEMEETALITSILADQFTTRKIVTMLGMLNHYAWRIMSNAGVLEKIEYLEGDQLKVKPGIKIKEFQKLLVCCREGNQKIEVAQQSLSKYVEKYWSGSELKELRAFHSVPTLDELRIIFADVLQVFEFDTDRPKGGKWGAAHDKPGEGVATPPIFEKVDLIKILWIYRTLYLILKERIETKLYLKGIQDCDIYNYLPDHGGALMVEAFNTAFGQEFTFQGTPQNVFGDGNIYCQDHEEIELNLNELVRWKFKKFKKMAKGVWTNIVTRLGQFCEGFIPSPKPEPEPEPEPIVPKPSYFVYRSKPKPEPEPILTGVDFLGFDPNEHYDDIGTTDLIPF